MNSVDNYFSKEEINSDIGLNYDDKLYLTYNFIDRTCLLQCCFKKDEYTHLFSDELLNSNINEENSHIYTIGDYENDSSFILYKVNDDIKSIVYIKNNDLQKLDQLCRPTSFSLINSIKSYRVDSFKNSHSTVIYNSEYGFNDTPKNRILGEKCKKLYTKYSMSKDIITSSYLLNNIHSVINHYIATKELDTEKLLNNYMILTDFANFCHSSFPLISNFVYDPENTDCRQLSDAITNTIDNIDRLVDIYLKEELEVFQSKEKGEYYANK